MWTSQLLTQVILIILQWNIHEVHQESILPFNINKKYNLPGAIES